MTPHDLVAAFELVSEAPDGVARLRELVLQLAVRGRLVPQDVRDEPASLVLERIAAEKARLVREKRMRKQRATHPVSGAPPFALPGGWTWCRLADLGPTQTGATPKKALLNAEGLRVPFVRPNDISWAGVDFQRESVPAIAAEATGRLAGPNAVLMVCIGTVGKTGLCGERVTFNQQINALEPLLVSPAYVAWAVRCPWFQLACRTAASATTISILNKGKWEALPVPLPPLAEQHRIVAKVDELIGVLDRLEAARDSREATRVALRDAALAALREADSSDEVEVAWQRIAERMDDLFTDPADVEPLRQTVLQLAVRGRLVPQDEGDELATGLLERTAVEKARLVKEKKIRKSKVLPPVSKDEVPFDVPGGWVWCRLADLGATQTGATPKKALLDAEGPRVPFVRPNDIGWAGVDTQRESVPATAAEATGRLAGPNAVMMVCIGTVGKSGLCRERVTFNQQINALEPLLASPNYVAWAVGCPTFQSACHAAASATTISILNKGKWEALPIPLPPLAEQHRIVAKVDEVMTLLHRLAERLTSVVMTQDSYAAAAVRGVEA